jgi:membrane-associated phospholipid phosphatase
MVDCTSIIVRLMSVTPIAIILGSFVFGLSLRYKHVRVSNIFLLLSAGMLSSMGIAKGLKVLSSLILPEWITSRPVKNNDKCHNLSSCSLTSSTSYTSAHATMMGFFGMFITMIATDMFRKPLSKDNWLMISVPWISAITIASERVYLGCHSIWQILIGLMLGSGLASGYYVLVRKWIK